MTLNTQASFDSSTYTPDQLVAANAEELMGEKITLLSGENRTRGAVLGRKATAATVAAAVAGAGNTGNGVVTLNATPFGASVKAGTYRAVFVEPTTNLGTFVVEDPDGVVLGKGVVGTEFQGAIVFTIAD